MKTTLSHIDLLHGQSFTPCAVEAASQNKARLLLLLITVALFVFTQSGAAAPIEVTNTNDSGPGSLRQAIIDANAEPNPDVISRSSGGTIEIATPLPQLLHEVQIIGKSQPFVVVQPASGVECRIFTVAAEATVTISGISIRNGLRTSNIVGADSHGGGIFNSGNLTLLRCEIAGNRAVGSNNSSGNGGDGRGGGIYNNSDATLTVDHCTVSENKAEGGSGNASSGSGGDGEGGGIYNLGRLTILSSTLSGNLVQRGTGSTQGKADGGGLYSGPAPINPMLTSCTVSNNFAGRGGGLYASRPGTIRSTILAENSAAEGPECYGTLNSHDYNLIQTTGGIIIGGTTTHNITNTPANLGPLQANGGPTRTHRPNSSSPAVDNGDDVILNAPLNIITDQRLKTRNAGLSQPTGVDIGAVEGNAGDVPSEDFNGDGYADFTLYRSSDRKTALWYLTGNAFDSSAYGPTLPAGWHIVDSGDFNFDGQNDYLLWSSTTRQTAVWFMANATLLGGVFGPTLPEGWTLIGAANFGNGSDMDYLLFKPATRQTAIWYLRDINYFSAQFGPTLPSGWLLLGGREVDFDGNRDFILYEPATRRTAIWFLKGNTYDHSAYGPTAPSGWEVVGFANFNANQGPDLVLFNASTRRTAIWLLTGTEFLSSVYGPTLPSGWQLVSP